MSAGALAEARSNPSTRRQDILDAAETCFVRNGFHRTTMQDLARQAGMTAGNIYHYFKSKEAVVLGLAEHERARGAALVADLARAGDRRMILTGIIAQHFAEIPREVAILRLDLWSEATRNPAIAAMHERFEEEGRAFFIDLLAGLATSGECDPASLYETMDALMKGIIVNRALTPDYDPAPAVAQLHAVIDAGLAGRLSKSSKPDGGASR
ncbi:TetR/AcrR family transcriptional regulator [Methylobacterium marchantiae]|uniref:TetR/AcrR family transcriptional regulator n=1 Tax=Methylobacterium marchantiae TaxID=600331 RepID=A0ABW3X2J6_9HYPH|nr:HTH-type transcriptional regulator BetI [Methylobacterium marchantiae]